MKQIKVRLEEGKMKLTCLLNVFFAHIIHTHNKKATHEIGLNSS